MLCFSQTTGYTVHALVCVGENQGAPCLIRDIARCTRIPRPYLAKIMHQLARRGLVVAKRGWGGGIALRRPSDAISLLDIVEAVEGPGWAGDCLLGLDDCAARLICPSHEVWKDIRRQIEDVLRQTTLADVARYAQNLKNCGAKDGKPSRSASVSCQNTECGPCAQPVRRGRNGKGTPSLSTVGSTAP
ncbi:MAG: Rrf2 family transcriptional regulator [Verrucomicrobia bacterium]|nr:Rrf2 family transcriptional regulator [Verrucomicrobiota bacterium]